MDDPRTDDEARALPLRMIVEWHYCPRLFHYMHVEGVMVANAHVWRGRHAHQRADTRGSSRPRRQVDDVDAGVEADAAGEAAEPDVPAAWREARAVDLGATSLGVVAKLDGVLLDDHGAAIPTELKSGSAPDVTAPSSTIAPGVWDSDAVHVALQALVLEASGYAVPRGEIYYRASKKRVLIPWSEALRAHALAAIEGAREAQRASERPAPLVDSPKCRGCSLVETCLPDESRLLREGVPSLDEDPVEGTATPPKLVPLGRRRLVASRIEGRSVTVSMPGASVRKEAEALVVTPAPSMPDAKSLRVALDQIEELAVVGSVNVTTHAVMACLERAIPVSFHTAHGKLLGCVTAGVASNAALRATQHEVASDRERSLALAREFIRGKLRNQRVLLRRHGAFEGELAGEFESLLRKIDAAGDADALRGVEGRAAVRYFEAFSRLLVERGGEGFAMNGRSRRPPRDPTNAMLSFGYAIVAKDCAGVLLRVGFDPMRGFLHGMGWGRASLALDLMEEFRVLLVDSTVLRLVAERRVTDGDFHRELQGVTLKPGARRAFLQALDQRREEEITHPLFGYRVSYRRAVELQARVLARVLDGETPRYVALTTR